MNCATISTYILQLGVTFNNDNKIHIQTESKKISSVITANVKNKFIKNFFYIQILPNITQLPRKWYNKH